MVLEGFGLGATGAAVGEVCFNTAMTGYQEILTDPSYAGQMLKPPHPIALAAYAAAARINPNNHALDGGPATAKLEREAVGWIAAMFGVREPFLGHLTSSGTIANLAVGRL